MLNNNSLDFPRPDYSQIFVNETKSLRLDYDFSCDSKTKQMLRENIIFSV